MFTLLFPLALASAGPAGADNAAGPAADLAVHTDSRAPQARHGHRRHHRPPPPPPPPRRGPVVVVHGHSHSPPPPARAPAATHDVSLTLSAIHLAVPIAAVNAEFQTTPNSSIGLLVGFGAPYQRPAYDLGLEGRGYVFGNFDSGLYLGGEGRLTTVPFYQSTDEAGVALAGFIGAKTTFSVPITLDAQIGPQVVWSQSYTAFGPMVQVGAGFSF